MPVNAARDDEIVSIVLSKERTSHIISDFQRSLFHTERVSVRCIGVIGTAAIADKVHMTSILFDIKATQVHLIHPCFFSNKQCLSPSFQVIEN